MRPLFVLFGLAATAGCGSPAAIIASPPEYAPKDQAKAGVIKNQDQPLIIEWPAAQRTKLEAMARRGAVAVRYEGERMDVLRQCRVPAAYGYVSTTPQRERVTIRNQDELRATLPFGVARLEGELKKAGQLNVSLTIVGTFEADKAEVRRDELAGDCTGVTHVVTALTVGAFEFVAGADASMGAGAAVGAGPAAIPVGGAQSAAKREVLNQGGDQAACAKATAEDTVPPYGCGALLRVEVVRLQPPRPPAPPAAEPTASSATPPAGSASPPAESAPPAETAPAAELPPVATAPTELPPVAPPSSEPARPTPREPPDFTPYEPSTRGQATLAPSPDDSRTAWIVIGTLVTLGVLSGVIAGIYVATKNDSTKGGGAGTEPVTMVGRPVLQW